MRVDTTRVATDYIIIGSGIAGLRGAIDLARAGRVTVFTKTDILESNSAFAQGGIAAAVGENDNVESHYSDTMAAGAGLCDPDAVRILVQEGPDEIERLVEWGADLDRHGQKLLLAREGGHSVARVVHGNGGLTGSAVVQALLRQARANVNVDLVPFTCLRDLLVDGNRVVGVEVQRGDEIIHCHARATLIATGGGSQVYRETTNPGTATGDGLAAAYRAGAVLRDVEFVQFHPTVLNIPGAPRFLLSEALRGEGGRIVDERGERFVDELATRDKVSRAVYRKITEGKNAKVFLDLSGVSASTLETKFRHIYMTCRSYGMDIARDRLPITPAAHYFMGGVRTDLEARTSLPGLYAAGEVASTGVHGANRLASNSLLEALVFGRRAAKAMCDDALPAHGSAATGAAAHAPGKSNPAMWRTACEQIRETTWRCAGVVRDADGLRNGGEILKELHTRLPYPPPDIEGVTARSLLALALIIHDAAAVRTESRGGHYREDFPDTTEPGLHSHIRKGASIVLE